MQATLLGRDKAAFNDVNKQLSNYLFDGVKLDQLNGIDKLYIFPDGVFASLPIGLLSPSGTRLGSNRQVIYSPSIRLFNRSNTEEKHSLHKKILAVGNPIFQTYQLIQDGKVIKATPPSLPETEIEMQEISKVLSDYEIHLLSADQATQARIINENIAEYNLLHFATHGVLPGELKGLYEPALLLTGTNQDDGLLTASEVANLNINADLVVLSACNTGVGKPFRGESVMGLGRAFLLAGAKNVIVSLWPVDSYATTVLMSRFYSELDKSGEPSLALMKAKEDIRRLGTKQYPSLQAWQEKLILRNGFSNTPFQNLTFEEPYYWAGFILISGKT